MHIIFFGKPGCGKGTQASLFAERKGYAHLATGDLLREVMRSDTDIGQKVSNIVQRGDLVSDEIIFDLLKKAWDCNQDTIFDGFPRRIEQAYMLDRLLMEYQKVINYVIMFQVDDPIIISRVMERSKREKRSDDNEKVIRSRLEVYRKEVAPIEEYYNKKGILYYVDALQEIDDIFLDINKIIESNS